MPGNKSNRASVDRREKAHDHRGTIAQKLEQASSRKKGLTGRNDRSCRFTSVAVNPIPKIHSGAMPGCGGRPAILCVRDLSRMPLFWPRRRGARELHACALPPRLGLFDEWKPEAAQIPASTARIPRASHYGLIISITLAADRFYWPGNVSFSESSLRREPQLGCTYPDRAKFIRN